MSWNPLRKLSMLQRQDSDPSTQSANETLEKLIHEFDSAESVTKSLYQAAKKLPDHILCMGKFESKLADELATSSIFQENEFMKTILEEWFSFSSVTNTIGDEYVITVQRSIIEPLKQLKHAFTEIRSAIRMHESIQFDVIKFQRKMANYSEKEKTGTNLVKLEECKQSLANSQKEFTKRTQILINDLSKFLTGSLEMLRPLLEGFIAAEVAWIRACKRSLDGKSSINSSIDHTSQSSNQRLKNVEESFKSLNMLSICNDSK